MDFIEGQGAVSDELTPALLAISDTGRPLAVKHAAKTRETRGQFRRIGLANSRETGWRKPVKSAEKSLNQPSDPGSIFASMGPGEPYVKAFFVMSEEGEIARAYEFDDTEAAKKLETLRRAADVLHDFHAAMRGELTGGW